MDSEARLRMLSTWLIVVALFLLVMSIKSRAWVVLHGDHGHIDLGLWAEQGCDEDDCDKLDRTEYEDAPRTGGLGILTLVLGLSTGAALIYQVLDGRHPVAAYLAVSSIAVSTFMVFGHEGGLPGAAHTAFVLACLSALIASALRPAPPPPPAVADARTGGSAMQPPPAPPPEP